MRLLPVAVILVIAPVAQAEIYLGIGPHATYGEVQKRFPNAKFNREIPAWASPSDVMYSVTGDGIVGTIVILFYDDRPWFLEESQKTGDPNYKETAEELANQTDQEALTVSWVRWIPESPIPIGRLVSKYGKPDGKKVSDEGYVPIREWKSKGVTAYLNASETAIDRIDFNFTINESREAFRKRWGHYPGLGPKTKK